MADEMLKNAQPQELESQIGEEDGLKEQLLRMCRQNKLAAFSAVLILVVILIAIFAPVLAPYGEAEQDLISRLQGPSAAHWFGTDELGRDVFSRILYGSRLSLTIGILPSIISLVVGIFFGLLAGYFGGWVDYVIMRLADIMLSIPAAGHGGYVHPGSVHRQPVYRAFPHQLGQCGPRGAQPDPEPEGERIC